MAKIKTLADVKQEQYDKQLAEFEKLDPKTETSHTSYGGQSQVTRRDGVKGVSKPNLPVTSAEDRTAYAVEHIWQLLEDIKSKLK